MKIRSITCFLNPEKHHPQPQLAGLQLFATDAKNSFQQAGFEVQTVRLACTPFSDIFFGSQVDQVVPWAVDFEKQASEHGFDYLSIGPAVPLHPECFSIIPAILQVTQNVFATGLMATAAEGISLPAVRACADIIHRSAPITPDGFANLRFSALANVGPNGPFFPAAYHKGSQPAFALAIESADTAIEAFSAAKSLAEARQNLVLALEKAARSLSNVAENLAAAFKIEFKGLDISLAPFPQDWCSLGAAVEKLGLPSIGLNGEVAAAAFLADTIDQGVWRRTGFNGLMLPVLEDSLLARRSAEGMLSIKDLLLFSAVCGAGLDTVPLPGDASVDQLNALLLDVAALAVRLGKPLTARLMPVPGLKAGEMTDFHFDFFSNGRTLDLPARPMTGLLAGNETFQLHPRQPNRQ
jgi:uncharacterized protein (UPF0210 family)